jgi:hypothetical protein
MFDSAIDTKQDQDHQKEAQVARDRQAEEIVPSSRRALTWRQQRMSGAARQK